MRSPKEVIQVPLYKRHPKQIPLRTKTPTIPNVEPIEKNHSFTKFENIEKPRRIIRDRKSIRTKREFNTKPEVNKLTPKKSPNKSKSRSKSPKIMKSNDKMQSPFFNNVEEKSSKRVKIQQPKFEQEEADEEIRNLTIHKALSKKF